MSIVGHYGDVRCCFDCEFRTILMDRRGNAHLGCAILNDWGFQVCMLSDVALFYYKKFFTVVNGELRLKEGVKLLE